MEVKVRGSSYLVIELTVASQLVPSEATELRFHSCNLAALAAAVAYGYEVPPARLAVGEATTTPKGGSASPGVYYSDDLEGCLYYAHGGPYQIGVAMVLQAPPGTVCSSGSNRVTYQYDQHLIRGAIVFKCRIRSEVRRHDAGEAHPLISPANKCQISSPYRQYSYMVGGYNHEGRYEGDRWRRGAEPVVKGSAAENRAWSAAQDALFAADRFERIAWRLDPSSWPRPYLREPSWTAWQKR